MGGLLQDRSNSTAVSHQYDVTLNPPDDITSLQRVIWYLIHTSHGYHSMSSGLFTANIDANLSDVDNIIPFE